jgi:MFS transporter, MHS family, proline/betaine transporter
MSTASQVAKADSGLMAEPQAASPSAQQAKRAVLAASVGNILEWYDFAVYGYVAGFIAKNFFSPGDQTSALLASFAVFGIGFIARPLGGIVIGGLADRKGRKPALLLTIMLMAIGTLMIGVMPTYGSIGVTSTVLLVIARLMQGFAAGGEWGTATGFLVEWAPEGKRGFYGSAQQSTVMLGLLLGSGIAALCSTLLSTSALENWGWRLPFLFGALIGPVGLYVRRSVGETPAFSQKAHAPATDRASGLRPAVRLFALVATPFAVVFTFMSYFPTFSQQHGGLTRTESLWSNSIGLVVLVVLIPFMGKLSDRVGRRPMMIVSNLGFLLLSWPLLWLTTHVRGFGTVVLVQSCFSVLYAIYTGAGAPAYVELFKTSTRMFWLSTSYNICGIFFGAFAGYISTWMIQTTHSPLSVAYFVLFATIITGIGLIGMKETAHAPLE